MNQGQASIPQPRLAAVHRLVRRLVPPVCCVAGAALAGVLAGWLATSLLVSAAPTVGDPALRGEVALPAAPQMEPTIAVEPLSPPEPPSATMILGGPAHGPSELAPLLARLAQGDPSAPAATGTMLPGAPHRPAELYLLLMAQSASKNPDPVPASRPGRPHTMAEIVLLYGILEQRGETRVPEIAVRATWSLDEASNPAPEPAAQPEADVAITESGPALPEESQVALEGDRAGPPMIAIMIDDLGLNTARSARVAALPAPLTMAFIPYGDNLEQQTRLAAASGHELFLHLPMEPIDPNTDPGPHALLESLDPQRLAGELSWNLDRFSGYVGVNNHMGSLLTQNREAMALVMAELRRRNLLFVDSVTSPGSVAYESALQSDLGAARRDIFIDNTPEVAAILGQLERLEEVARNQGSAIGIGHPHDATIAALAQWLPEMRARGFLLVPASRIIADRAMLLAQHEDQ